MELILATVPAAYWLVIAVTIATLTCAWLIILILCSKYIFEPLIKLPAESFTSLLIIHHVSVRAAIG